MALEVPVAEGRHSICLGETDSSSSSSFFFFLELTSLLLGQRYFVVGLRVWLDCPYVYELGPVICLLYILVLVSLVINGNSYPSPIRSQIPHEENGLTYLENMSWYCHQSGIRYEGLWDFKIYTIFVDVGK